MEGLTVRGPSQKNEKYEKQLGIYAISERYTTCPRDGPRLLQVCNTEYTPVVQNEL
jgi:hypothetical protein